MRASSIRALSIRSKLVANLAMPLIFFKGPKQTTRSRNQDTFASRSSLALSGYVLARAFRAATYPFAPGLSFKCTWSIELNELAQITTETIIDFFQPIFKRWSYASMYRHHVLSADTAIVNLLDPCLAISCGYQSSPEAREFSICCFPTMEISYTTYTICASVSL
jgi:hypothetical protein